MSPNLTVKKKIVQIQPNYTEVILTMLSPSKEVVNRI